MRHVRVAGLIAAVMIIATQAGLAQPPLRVDRDDIGSRDLFYGSGGPAHVPQAPFVFVKEDFDGTKPKVIVTDANQVKWKLKFGSEAQPEVAATRILWAVGYWVDEDYYLPLIHVEGLPAHLQRGRSYVGQGGTIRDVRFERKPKGDKKIGDWDWFDNPFVGTRDLNALRVIMAVISNWDLKRTNNSIRNLDGVEGAYYVGDLGRSFSRSRVFGWSNGGGDDYATAPFIARTTATTIDFDLLPCPTAVRALGPLSHANCKGLGRVVEGIPRADAHWTGELLSQLSDEQIGDAFRAAHYSPDQVLLNTKAMRKRIDALLGL